MNPTQNVSLQGYFSAYANLMTELYFMVFGNNCKNGELPKEILQGITLIITQVFSSE